MEQLLFSRSPLRNQHGCNIISHTQRPEFTGQTKDQSKTFLVPLFFIKIQLFFYQHGFKVDICQLEKNSMSLITINKQKILFLLTFEWFWCLDTI